MDFFPDDLEQSCMARPDLERPKLRCGWHPPASKPQRFWHCDSSPKLCLSLAGVGLLAVAYGLVRLSLVLWKYWMPGSFFGSLLIGWLLTPALFAQQMLPPSAPDEVRNYVRVQVQRNGISDWGSGVVVEVQRSSRPIATIVTNRHVCQEATNGATISIWYADDTHINDVRRATRYRARLLGISELADVAVLQAYCDRPGERRWRLTGRLPQPNQWLRLGGFGGDNQLIEHHGRHAGYTCENDMIVEGAPSRSGDSGGPILGEFDGQTEITGILWGSVNGDTYGVPADALLRETEHLLGRPLMQETP